jgi:hypothetical protein
LSNLEELKKKISEAIQKTGYPLEQRVGHALEQMGWSAFHSVEYRDPVEGKQRELDLLAYKLVRDRRIELRISCKRSKSKQWVFFTEDSSRYIQHGSDLKLTPVEADNTKYRKIPKILRDLPFFSSDRTAINFMSVSGKDSDAESRAVIRDANFSVLNSIYRGPFPHALLFDQRGTIVFFIVIFDGLMFESYFCPEDNNDVLNQINYCQFEQRFPLETKVSKIINHDGQKVLVGDAAYWFGDRFRTEFVTFGHFEEHLKKIESAFNSLSDEDVGLFGKPWTPENFPSVVGEPPDLEPSEDESGGGPEHLG